MATRPKTVIESHDGEELSPITITKNVLTDDGQNLHDILSDRKEDMITPTIENSSSIFRVGQGDNVDYSENVVDGAYESCVLKGVTKFIDNDTGEILDSFVENRDLSLIDCKSPILSNVGKNLISSFTESMSIQPTTGNAVETDEWIANDDFIRVKKNTPYTISLTGDIGMTNGGWVYVYPYDLDKKFLGIDERKDLGKTNKTFMFDYDCFVKFTCKAKNVTSLQLEESSSSTSYEPYKSNILSCNGDKIELTEDMFEQGSIGGQVGKTYDQIKSPAVSNRIRSKSTIKVKPNTTYSIKCKEGYIAWFSIHDANDLYVTSWGFNLNASSLILTTSSSTYGLGVIIQKPTGNITPNEVTNVQLHEVDKTIVLRSLPNGVCDTLNVETGEYVQRIGEVVLNGSQGVISWWNTTSTIGVGIPIPTMKNISKLNCDKLPVVSYGAINNNTYDKDGIASWDTGNIIRFRIEKSKLTTEDVDGVKQYLQQNPITVQYELTTPIIKTVDLSGYPFAYENGHVVLSSGSIEQSLTPKVEYSVATNRNGQIRSNQKMVERHQKQLDQLQAIILANLVNTQYEQTLTNLKYDLKNVREEVK